MRVIPVKKKERNKRKRKHRKHSLSSVLSTSRNNPRVKRSGNDTKDPLKFKVAVKGGLIQV